ncbi:MAG: hypothetical protein WAW52_07090 [Methanothrix sp.]
MDPFLAFLAAVIFVSLIIPRLGPFLSLIISSIVFGLLAGMGGELQGYISTGLSRIFSSLAIVVFSGALLAEYLRSTESLDRIVADLGRLADKSLAISGAAGYLISLPVMCSITAYMILQPVVSGLAGKGSENGKRALFMTAVCSIISFNLIYPSPVMITLSTGLGAAPHDLLMRGIPISLVLFALAYILMQHVFPEKAECIEIRASPKMSWSRAWAPLLLPMALILLGDGLPEKARIFADPGIALLIASGAFMFSYVTDPYFWLIKSSTGASMKQTVLGYTLPLSLLGLAAFAIAAISSIL